MSAICDPTYRANKAETPASECEVAMLEISANQLAALFILAIPVATISWTVTHEEVFHEPREWCKQKSQTCRSLFQRKLFYLFTCEFCFSFYVSAAAVAVARYALLYSDWRGYVVSWLSLIWVANLYMALHARLRLDIKRERVEIANKEQQQNGNGSVHGNGRVLVERGDAVVR